MRGFTELKYRLLDLFCGAGGAAIGYHLAGFEVVGIDINPQPHFPFEFHQADALRYPLQGFDAYHASPPCQAYTKAGKQWRLQGKDYPDLISLVRALLLSTGKPYIIENVPDSPLINPILLSGADFGIKIHRPRLFECNFEIPFKLSMQLPKPVKMGRFKEGEVLQPVGHFAGVDYARDQMNLPNLTQRELSQAIPPAYTQYIGKHLEAAIKGTPLKNEPGQLKQEGE